jgi:hypothetical protein
MNKKERYERESQAKGGSVPPDMRRSHKGRSESAREHMPNEGSSFDKRANAKLEQERHGVRSVDIERLPEKARKDLTL